MNKPIECEDAISRSETIKYLNTNMAWYDEDGEIADSDEKLKAITDLINGVPSAQPKTGHWIEIAKYSDGRHEIECSECGSHIFDRGHANSYVVKEKYKYCPRCGFRMIEPQESEVQE